MWRLHTLTAGPLHLDTLADRGGIAFSGTRFDLASPNRHSHKNTVEERDTELCSLFMRIWSIHCVWRLHTLTAGSHCLDTLADCGQIAF